MERRRMSGMSDEQLEKWLKQDLEHVEHGLSDEALTALVEDAKCIIELTSRASQDGSVPLLSPVS